MLLVVVILVLWNIEVYGLILLKKKFLKEYDLDICIYSDSLTAITWVKNKRANTTLKENDKTKQAFKLLREAEKWLEINKYTTKILKWDTKTLGEIKADFGRK